jgi:hypothetical protein
MHPWRHVQLLFVVSAGRPLHRRAWLGEPTSPDLGGLRPSVKGTIASRRALEQLVMRASDRQLHAPLAQLAVARPGPVERGNSLDY